jgi:phosphoketolase
MPPHTLTPELLRPLTLVDVKHTLVGHWGTTPGQSFIHMRLNLIEHKQYIAEHGEDLPEIRNWKWRIAESSSRPAS